MLLHHLCWHTVAMSLALLHYTLSPYKSITAHVYGKFSLRLKRENCVNKRWPPHAASLSSLSSCQRTLQTYKSWSVGERGSAQGHWTFNKVWVWLAHFTVNFFCNVTLLTVCPGVLTDSVKCCWVFLNNDSHSKIIEDYLVKICPLMLPHNVENLLTVPLSLHICSISHLLIWLKKEKKI